MIKNRKCKLILLDEVNCIFTGLHPDHVIYFYEKYGIFAKGYFFNPKFQVGSWDGKIRFFHKSGKCFVNLLDELIPSVVSLGYHIDIEDNRKSAPITPPLITEDFFSHVNDPDTGEPWKVRDYQIDAVNSFILNAGGIVIAGTGGGKAQPLYSKVLTSEGWKKMGDIIIGESVYTPNSSLAKVIGIFPQGKKEIYEITFHDGTKVRACKEHLWKVKHPVTTYRNNTETRFLTTGDMLEFLNKKNSDAKIKNNISIPLCDPINYNTNHALTIDPYFLGLLIGDGMISSGSIVISSADDEILESVTTQISQYDMHLNKRSKYDYAIVKREKQNTFPPSKNILIEKLKNLNLYGKHSYDKFIPLEYKMSSIEDRFSLIQGLMDTDGTVRKRKGGPSYCTTSKQLAHDVQEIIQSLGGICTITTKIPTYTYLGEKKQGRLAYICHIAHPTPIKLFRLTRKREMNYEKHAAGRAVLTRRIKSIVMIETEEAQCILLDSPEHLYITDNFIVTHNTSICAALALSYERAANFRSIIIVPDTTLTDQTKEEYEFFGLDTGEYSGSSKDLEHQHVVATWQTLKNNPVVIQQFDILICDEVQGARGPVLNDLLVEHGKHISYRFGCTGTLPEEESDAMSVKIAIGEVQYEVPAHFLIEKGHLANLDIDIVQMEVDLKEQYNNFLEDTKDDPDIPHLTYRQFKDSYFPDFTSEKKFLHSEKSRLDWIANYVESFRLLGKGNVLCLVNGVQFGKKLTKIVPDSVFLHGKDDTKVRKEIYQSFKDNDDLIVFATVNIAGTGLNIKRVFNLLLIDLGKSFIRVIQAIGRGLRKAHDKDYVYIGDICSDLKYSRRHLTKRMKYYSDAKYPHKKRTVDY